MSPRVSHQINAFNAGELSPELEGRTDLDKYGKGAKRIENFIVHPEGGAHRRPGTRFVADAAATTDSRLVPFIFSTEQAYVLEFSNLKIRVFADEVQVGAAARSLDSTLVNTTTDEFTFVDHGYAHNQGPFHFTSTPTTPPASLSDDTDYWIVTPKTLSIDQSLIITGTDIVDAVSAHQYVDEMGPFRLSTSSLLPSPLDAFTDYYIVFVDTTTFKLSLTAGGAAIDITTTGTGTLTFGPTGDYVRDKFRLAASDAGAPIVITTNPAGPYVFTPNPAGTPTGLPLEIPSPLTTAEVAAMHYVQSADFLFIAHGDHRPIQLSRVSDTQWALDSINIIDGPYLERNIDVADTIATTGTTIGTRTTLTCLTTTAINGGAGWQASTDIGRLVRISVSGADWGYIEIDTVTSATVAHGNILETLGSPTSDKDWRLGAWYPSNYPSAISFFEQRLGFGGVAATPQTVYASKTGLINVFSPDDSQTPPVVLDTSSFNFQIASNRVNAIQWLGLSKGLHAGTKGAVFLIRASLEDEAITPTNVNISQVTSIGSQGVQPINISDQLLYITKNNQELRGIPPGSRDETPPPINVTLLAKHIFGRTLTVDSMAFQQDRQQVLWCVLSDGTLACVTYVPEQEVFAWHRHIMGGSLSGSDNAEVTSVAVIPSLNETHDRVWITVKRTVNSSTVQHVEFIEDEWLDDTATSMRFMDSAPAAYSPSSGGATSTITGLDHLEGETVQVLANGAVHPDRTVSSGSITLDATYTDVLAGLAYTSELETVRLELPDPEGSSTGKVARIDHVVLRAYNTIGGEIGPDTSHMDQIQWSDVPPTMDTAPTGFTGDKKVAYRGPFQRSKVMVFRQSQPLPFNLLSINVLGSTGSR